MRVKYIIYNNSSYSSTRISHHLSVTIALTWHLSFGLIDWLVGWSHILFNLVSKRRLLTCSSQDSSLLPHWVAMRNCYQPRITTYGRAQLPAALPSLAQPCTCTQLCTIAHNCVQLCTIVHTCAQLYAMQCNWGRERALVFYTITRPGPQLL